MPLGGLFGYLGQRQVNKTNIKLAREARDHDVNMWNMQNQYNTPEMQMQRMREAGLNPNLMYGQGNTGNAAPAPKAPVPEVGNELAGLAQMSILPALSLYQDFKVKNAQIDNIQAQADATRQNAALTALRRVTQNFTNQRLGHEEQFWETDAANRSLRLQGDTNITNFRAKTAKSMFHEALPAQIESIVLRNSLLNESIRGQRLENDLNEELKPYGGSNKDNLLYRTLLKFILPKEGSKQPNILNDPFGHLKHSIKHPFGK